MLQANSPCYFELIFSSLLATLSLCCTISIHVKPILLGLLFLYGQCCGNVGPLLGLCQTYIWQLGRFYDLSSNRLKSRTKSKHATRPSQNLQCLQLLLIYACAQKKTSRHLWCGRISLKNVGIHCRTIFQDYPWVPSIFL